MLINFSLVKPSLHSRVKGIINFLHSLAFMIISETDLSFSTVYFFVLFLSPSEVITPASQNNLGDSFPMFCKYFYKTEIDPSLKY